jgi:hydroxymethylpyrimidine pyrophosphatase-like HAD family hydrolase
MNPIDVMIYSDMDGTLLSSWEKGPIISEKNTHAIHQFIENGGLFSIATGRNMKNGPTYFNNYILELPMVLVNGALIYDQKHQTIMRKVALNPSFLGDL